MLGSTSPAMSASASDETSVGIFWYSACMMSGAPLPAWMAVSSLVTAGSPPSCLFTVTWMSGFSSFQISTTFSMFGAHVQNVRSTGPAALWSSSPVVDASPPEQAVASSAVTAIVEASLKPVCRRMNPPRQGTAAPSRRHVHHNDRVSLRLCTSTVHGHSSCIMCALVKTMFRRVT